MSSGTSRSTVWPGQHCLIAGWVWCVEGALRHRKGPSTFVLEHPTCREHWLAAYGAVLSTCQVLHLRKEELHHIRHLLDK